MKAVFISSSHDDKETKHLYTTLNKHLSQQKGVEIDFIQRKKATDTQFFLAQKKLIEGADCVIAEVTHPDVGVGGQIVYALTRGIPVLALIYKENKDELTPMLSGNPSDNLFLEHYSEDNISYILNTFFEHIRFVHTSTGKLIVIDGGDGSGKATQTKLLDNYLSSKNTPHKIYDFPRYYSSFHGKTIGRLLSGEFGTLSTISPYLASLAYALDRASVKQEMEDYLKKGGYIICNRYVTSNMAHQGGRFDNPLKRQEFLKWVYELEYKIHKMPKEAAVIYLYVPWQIGFELTKKKEARTYMKGKKLDIVEKDVQYRINSEQMFLEFCKTKKHWHKIDCVDNKGQLLSREAIFQRILEKLQTQKLLQ